MVWSVIGVLAFPGFVGVLYLVFCVVWARRGFGVSCFVPFLVSWRGVQFLWFCADGGLGLFALTQVGFSCVVSGLECAVVYLWFEAVSGCAEVCVGVCWCGFGFPAL